MKFLLLVVFLFASVELLSASDKQGYFEPVVTSDYPENVRGEVEAYNDQARQSFDFVKGYFLFEEAVQAQDAPYNRADFEKDRADKLRESYGFAVFSSAVTAGFFTGVRLLAGQIWVAQRGGPVSLFQVYGFLLKQATEMGIVMGGCFACASCLCYFGRYLIDDDGQAFKDAYAKSVELAASSLQSLESRLENPLKFPEIQKLELFWSEMARVSRRDDALRIIKALESARLESARVGHLPEIVESDDAEDDLNTETERSALRKRPRIKT